MRVEFTGVPMLMKRIAIALFVVVVAACGGGGGSTGGNPQQPTLFTSAGDSIVIPSGAFREYSVSGGVPPYQVSSSEPAIAVGNINGNTLSIGAIAGGKATIRIFDNKGANIPTEVTVGSSIPLYTTAPSPLNIGVNVTREFSVGGGSPPYTFTGGNDSVAVVQRIDATTWSITGRAANANGIVKIRDQAGAIIDIPFSTTPPELRISPDKLTMPAGIEAEITVSGGQPPYYSAGGIPAAVKVTPSVSTDGKFKIVGNLASKLDVAFVDTAGQSVKVEVEINTATVSFRLSPSPVSVSESSTDDLTFSLFGFNGDGSTAASSGLVCLYVSDPKYFLLDPERETCSTFSSALRTFKLVTGTRGNRCVAANTPVEIRAVDSLGSVATGTVTIVDNGTSCGATVSGLSVTPTSIAVQPGLSSDVLVRGGDGRYTAVSANLNIATAQVSGDIITVTGGLVSGATVITVIDADTGLTTTFTVSNGGTLAALTFSPTSVIVSPALTNVVTIGGGSGSFSVATGDPAIATGSITGSQLTVTGGAKAGSTTMTVTDTVTLAFGTVTVTNGSAGAALTVNPGSVSVRTDLIANVLISGGSGRYLAVSADPGIAVASIDKDVLVVKGGTITGSTTVAVRDDSGAGPVNVNITNNQGSPGLTVNPPVVNSTTGTVVTTVVQNGSGQYAVSNVDSAFVASISVKGATIEFTGGAETGTVNTVVTDLVSGQTVPVRIVNTKAVTLSATPSNVTNLALGGDTVSIAGGSGVFTIASSNSSIVSATISGRMVTLNRGSSAGSARITVTDSVSPFGTVVIVVAWP